MSTLERFGLLNRVNQDEPGKAVRKSGGNTGLNRVSRENRVSSPNHLRDGSHTHATHVNAKDASHMGHENNLVYPVHPVQASNGAGFPEPGSDIAPAVPGSSEPAEWQGEIEEMPPARHAEPDWWRPKPLLQGSLVVRLCAVGATVRTYGSNASIEVPAGIPADLLHEVEARGWRIIPGGRANPEAEHDSWLAGVPIAELKS